MRVTRDGVTLWVAADLMFAIIRNDTEVLSQPVPGGPVAWLDYGLTLATDWRYALKYETMRGACAAATIYGATVHTIGEFDDETARYRTGDGGSVGGGGCPRSEFRSDDKGVTAYGADGSRPQRGVPGGRAASADIDPARTLREPPQLAPVATGGRGRRP